MLPEPTQPRSRLAALLRRPDVVVRAEVLMGLAEAGFDDLMPAHLGVFQFPGPEGQRPGVLALRTQASKQAMNHLLRQLESAGYLTRDTRGEDHRTHVVRLTDRGRSAEHVIAQTMSRLEASWHEALGDDVFDALAHGLERLQEVIEAQHPPRGR